MLMLHIACAWAIFSVVSACILPNGKKLKILIDIDPHFEGNIVNSLTETKHFLQSSEAATIAKILELILEQFPVVDKFASLLPKIQTIIADEKPSRRAEPSARPYEAQRADARNSIQDMQASMGTIAENVGFLNRTGFKNESRVAMVHDIHNLFDQIVNRIGDGNSIFRKYPQLIFKTLLSISPLIVAFNALQTAIVPALTNHSDSLCKFSDTLRDYRSLMIGYRLNQIHLQDLEDYRGWHTDVYREFAQMKMTVLEKDKEANAQSTTVECLKNCEGHCIVDHGGLQFGAGYSESKCFRTYMECAKRTVEQPFDHATDLTNKYCSRALHQRSPKGTGWWTFIIHSVVIGGHSMPNVFCDNLYVDLEKPFQANPCDPFVKVSINNRTVFQTPKKWNWNSAIFNEIYNSGEISKTANITLEVWDDDSGFGGSNDDLIATWEMKLDEFLEKTEFQDRPGVVSVQTSSHWLDAFE